MPSYSLLLSSFSNLETSNLKKKAIVYLRIYRHLCIYSDVQNNLCPSVLRFDTLPSTIILAVNKNVAIFFSLSLGFLSSRDAFRNRSPSLPLCGHYSLVAGVQGIAIARKKKEKKKRKRNSHGIFRTILTDLTLKSRRRVNVNGV